MSVLAAAAVAVPQPVDPCLALSQLLLPCCTVATAGAACVSTDMGEYVAWTFSPNNYMLQCSSIECIDMMP